MIAFGHVFIIFIHVIIAENLADAKRLRGGVYFVDKLPMTPSGKVIKRLVKEDIIKTFKGTA